MADTSSSNPFRRKTSTISTPEAGESPPTTFFPSLDVFDASYQAPIAQQESAANGAADSNEHALKKAVKRVRVQSPPAHSHSLPSSAYTGGRADAPWEPSVRAISKSVKENLAEGALDMSLHVPAPKPAVSPATPEAPARAAGKAPINPFQRTLQTMDATNSDELQNTQRGTVGSFSPAKAAMDVDAFKRLLMTGNSGSNAASEAPLHRPGDVANSTDLLPLSRQHIFEPIQGAFPESPRTSHEVSETEDERQIPGTERVILPSRWKPPPPSSRHGKLIKLELGDDKGCTSPPTSDSGGSAPYSSSVSSRSYTDVNKTLPPAPGRASQDSDFELGLDRGSLGRKPESLSPSASLKKKLPPAPPISRRHSQLVSESKLNRSNSGRLSPKAEEESQAQSAIETSRPRSGSSRTISSIDEDGPRPDKPPPPPSRRVGSVRRTSQHLALTMPLSESVPPLSRSASGKAGSIHSIESMKRGVMSPPPPPPRLSSGRSSLDGLTSSPAPTSRGGGEYSRRSLDSNRKLSTASAMSFVENTEIGESPITRDVLADLSALQREIDALRNESEKAGKT